MIFLFCIGGQNSAQPFQRPRSSRCTQAVICPFAFLPTDYDTGIAQDFHVIGQPGLRQIHWFLQDTSTFLAAAQLFQNGKALRITQRLKHLGVLLVVSHLLTPHQKLLI